MDDLSTETFGTRQRKRAETFARIAESSLLLFQAQGYDGTTLDEIAEAAGISRRTFFHYYDSKDDILVSLQCEGFTKALQAMSEDFGNAVTPFAAVRDTLPKLVDKFETPESIVIGEIMNSSEILKKQKFAIYIEMENALTDALAAIWPSPEQRPALRLVATMAISVLRIAMENWRTDAIKRPLADYVSEGFATIESQF